MITGIYKITNKVNGHSYIGQSVDILARWGVHRRVYNNPEYDTYPLYRAIRKYGIDNFNFDVIEECSKEQLNEREIYWINYYNTFFDGYNQTTGGESAGHPMKLQPEELKKIDDTLLNTQLTQKEIANLFNVSEEMIQGINTGRYWKRDDINYPIRKVVYRDGVLVSKNHYCKNCGKEISRQAEYCVECSHLLQRKVVERPQPLDLAVKIVNSSFRSVAKEYGVTDNAIKKWCKSYGIPYKKPELKEYVKQNCPEALNKK